MKSHNAEFSPAEKSLQTLNSAVFERLEKLFRVAYIALLKIQGPFLDYEWMCCLEGKLGVDLGPTYSNRTSCKEFMVSIAEVERQKIEDELAQTNYCTIMSDGSTDVSGVENEGVYVHFARQGAYHCYFLGMVETECASASGIYSAIMESLHFNKHLTEEIQENIVGFAGDGASVNTGKLNGVIALFQGRINPSILMIQCMAHRVELGLKDAMKNVPLFSKVVELLDDIFKFYKSAKQKSELKSVFETLKLQFSMPTRVGGTRWVGHMLLAVKNMLKGYRALVFHLSKVSQIRSQSAPQSKAINFIKKLKSKSIIFFAHFLVDVISVLARLSKQLQERKGCVFQVHRQLETTLINLNKLGERDGFELRKVASSDTFEGEGLTGNTSEHDAQSARVIKGLVSCLQRRFDDLDKGIFSATKLADLNSWPTSSEDAKDFGDDCLMKLLDHFHDTLERKGVDLAAAEEEWTALKQALYKRFGRI
ncbi:zinc finger protein 862-like [Haliotis rubra]|uniref:zinc finger protein 862-like n=1 Tax=Haliotis rubra TaxID=36100 RepID=UPI001EE5A3AC|nr:zinc finger protein 862-like [Haliotis rubra]